MDIKLILLVYAHFILTVTTVESLHTDVQSYCQHDRFEATCPTDHVILIESARYGRMKKHSCIASDGSLGCSTDVIHLLDKVCSGRQSCTYQLSSIIHQTANPCRGFMSYLEIGYDCLKVETGDNLKCSHNALNAISPTSGHLSSLSLRGAFATSICPWTIRGKKGQRVKFSVSVYKMNKSINGNGCPFKIVMNEHGKQMKKPLCGFDCKKRTIFASSSNNVQLYIIVDDPVKTIDASFIISYTFEGCADISAPSNTIVKRTGDDVVVRCKKTRETWFLTCKHNKWVGQMGSCDQEPSAQAVKGLLSTEIPIKQGLIVAVILGLIFGVIIGFTSLGVFIIYRKRQQRIEAERDQKAYYHSGSMVFVRTVNRPGRPCYAPPSFPPLPPPADDHSTLHRLHDYEMPE